MPIEDHIKSSEKLSQFIFIRNKKKKKQLLKQSQQRTMETDILLIIKDLHDG